ncbi:MAG TPA: VWA domain-containing protein [Thermoanaerobaculia bacterium]|nr:VWA domain-containing protein [Thermoanaerobaculia bacterium]
MGTLFAEPALLVPGLLLAALAAGALLLSVRWRAARSAALVSPALAAKAGLAPAGGFPAVAAVLALLVALGLGAALARPRWGKTMETAQRRGADVVLVLDTSASMRAADVSPSRFVLARQAAQSLLSRLGSDRAALISCEGEAQALVPLTLDAAAVGLFLDAMEPGMGAKPGTSLASGIAAAADLFPAGSSGGKNAVVFSDGEDLEGGVEGAIARAKAEGITVHTVFVGAPNGSGAPVPDVDAAGRTSGFKSDPNGQPVLSRPDPELLRHLAAETGGSFTLVSPGRTDLEGVARQIDLGARRPLSEVLLTSLEERFQIPLGIAAGALGLLLLGAGRGRSASRGAKAPGFVRNLLRKGKRDAPELGVAALLLLALVAAPRTEAQQPAAVPPAPATAPPALPSASSNGAAAPAPPDTQASPDATAPFPFLSRIFSSSRSEAKRGQKALDEKKLDEAIAHFSRETEMEPKDLTGSFNLGTAQSRAGRTAEALASLGKARKEGRAGVAADAAFNTGQTLYREKQYEPAAAAFREALKRRPGDADAAWNYELCARRAEEEKQRQKEQQQKDQKNDKEKAKEKDGKDKQPQRPEDRPQAGDEEQKRKQQEKEFEKKANMTRDKAEQLLSAIERSDLDEQKKRVAEQRGKRRTARDW